MTTKFLLQVNAPGFDNSTLVGNELIGFAYQESLDGCARWALNVETQDGRRYDSFVKNDETPFTIRFGTQQNTDGPKLSRQKSLRTLQTNRQLIGNARAMFTFKGCCNGVALNMHRAPDKRWSKRKISDIVKELIEAAGLQAQVEQSEGKFDIAGCNQPTGQFISRYLARFAYSSKGRDWRLWVEDGKTVHFEPLRPTGNLRFTNLSKDGLIKLHSPQVIKDTRDQAINRSGKIEVRMYDPDSDRLVKREIGESQGAFNYFGSGRPVEREHVSETILVNMQKDRNTDMQPDRLVRQVGQSIWGRKGRCLYRLIGLCDYEPGISVNQQATVELAGPLGTSDVNSGTWVVSTVKNINARGSTKTWVALEKRWER